MSVKDIFEKHKNLSSGKKSIDEAFIEAESAQNVARNLTDQRTFEPPIVFQSGGEPSFAKLIDPNKLN